MNKLSLEILIMLLLFCSSISFSQQNETIAWSPEYKLEWKDYLGSLDPEVFANAKTSYKIEFIPENVMVDEHDRMPNYKKITVVAKFYKKHSWSVSKDQELLNHEQLHFDIAELFARKIRKRFLELKSKKESRFSVFYSEYKSLWNECRIYQRKYDQETNHGVNTQKNKEWEKLVRENLTKLNSY